MKRIINRKYFIVVVMLATMFSSCLRMGLDELPAYDDADITGIGFEHRFEDPAKKWIDGSNVIQYVTIPVSSIQIKKAGTDGNTENEVIVTPGMPTPSGSFTNAERMKITLNNLAGYVYLSNFATIEPIEGAPVLGTPGDFTQPRKYKVTAADGKTTKIWTIKVNALPEISPYEGLYIETGTLDRAGNPTDNLSAEVYLATVDKNTVWTQAAKSVFNNPAITYRIKVNPDNTVEITSNPGASVTIYQLTDQVSRYDPATKTFTLHYAYNAGARIFHTQLRLKE